MKKNIENLKPGDEVFVIKSNNGSSLLDNNLCVIKTNHGNGNYTVSLKDSNNLQYNIYSTGKADEFIIAEKENYIEYYKNKIVETKQKLTELQAELEFHEKYESMEDFVADKIEQLLKANTKEARVELLRTLKHSHIL